MSLGGLLLAGAIIVIAWWSNNQSLAELGGALLREQTGSVAVVAEPTGELTPTQLATTMATATPQPTQATASATLPTSPTIAAAATETVSPPTATVAPPTATSPPHRYSDLPTVQLEALPPEAQTTIDLIASDGPFPFERDGITFQNREGILPDKVRGYYREYTVITPGLDHRGARRIVAGDEGERYYTDDHYASFREVIE